MKTVEAPEGYGRVWQTLDHETYRRWFATRIKLHNEFMAWLDERRGDIRTVLEIGCGFGLYPIEHGDVFRGMDYTGIDVSEAAINHCRERSDFEFICGDFINYEWYAPFDLVFAHAVIDHVHHPDDFVRAVVSATDKYAFIGLYNGYRKDLPAHTMSWASDCGCYGTMISPRQICGVLGEILGPDEFEVKPFANEGVIEIHKLEKKSA